MKSDTKDEIMELVKEAEAMMLDDTSRYFLSGLRKKLKDPNLRAANAFSWSEDPEKTIFDGITGIPIENYEGLVLVFFSDGSCFMRTWIENRERNWRALGTD